MPLETRLGYLPGVIGKVTELHARYYAEQWGFGAYFEAKVASEMSDFIRRYDPSKDRIWSLVCDGSIEGSITIDGSSEADGCAHLRWFIVSDGLRGTGAGKHLMRQAVAFCREAGCSSIYLWTFHGLAAARHLYETYGFRLTEERGGSQWGTPVREQRFELSVDNPA